MLHRQEIKESSTPSAIEATEEETRALAAEYALQLLLARNPAYFPAGTHLSYQSTSEGSRSATAVRWSADNSVATVSLSRDFLQPDFWQGSTTTLLGIYAIVNSVAANLSQDDNGMSVQILIDGKLAPVIGEFDNSDPIQADFTLMAH
jgi:hypothetical protein